MTDDQWNDGREYRRTRANGKGNADAEWPEPDRIGAPDFGKPEPFPIDVVPAVYGDMIAAVAGNKQVPAALPALMGMAAASTILGPRLAIECEAGWVEPLNTYCAVAMEPGSGKSPATKDVIQGVRYLHRLLRANFADQVDQERGLVSQRLALAKERKAAKGSSDEVKAAAEIEIKELTARLKDLDDTPPPRILMPADVTPEALAREMSVNGEHGAVLDSEGTFFAILAGRYSGGVPNLDSVLKSYDADYVEVSRITREQRDMTRAVLTLGLAVQPAVLADAAQSRAMVEQGFLGRFYLAVPESMVGYRKPRGAAYDENAIAGWAACLHRLAQLPMADPSMDARQFPRLYLTDEAHDKLLDFRAWVEPRLRSDGELGDLPGWGSKHPARVLRTAGLLHLIKGRPTDERVDVTTMNTAIAIGRWAIPHAAAVFGMSDETPRAEDENALALLQWIHGRRPESVGVREVARNCRQAWAKKGKTPAVLAAIDRLTEAGWLRPQETTDKAGRATVIYACHPRLRGDGPLW